MARMGFEKSEAKQAPRKKRQVKGYQNTLSSLFSKQLRGIAAPTVTAGCMLSLRIKFDVVFAEVYFCVSELCRP